MIKRRISQIISLLILHSSWGPEAKWLCNPVLSCHSCALAWFACPVGIFVHYSGYHVFPFVALGTVLVVGVLVGRLMCGWVCPFGFLLDMLYKIPSPKFDFPAWTGYIKYGVLVLMVFFIPFLLGESSMYSFCRICPASVVQVTIPNIIAKGFSVLSVSALIKLAIFIVVVGFAVTSSRSFCKVLCPIAALLGPLNHVSFWAMSLPATRPCTGCKKCDAICPSNGQPFSRIAKGVPPNRAADCIVCHDCQHICPDRVSEPHP
jgi:polyferredoxin